MNTAEKVVPINPNEKVCKSCKQSKPLSEFDKHAQSANGVRAHCKECRHQHYLAQKDHTDDLRKNVIENEIGRNCLICGEIKPWDRFAKDEWGYKGKTASCKDCRNKKSRELYPDKRGGNIHARPDRVKRLYGVTWEFVKQTLANQYGRCANIGCSKEISFEVKSTAHDRAVIDHNHETGKFRAVLCHDCNKTLGVLETRKNKIPGLMDYLNKHKDN